MKRNNISPIKNRIFNGVKIAVQKEGRLKNPSIEYLMSLGLEFSKENGRALVVPCKNDDVEILYVRHSDIPQYVQNGAADFGIVGENLLFENDFNVKVIKKLDFGKCKLVLAVPRNSEIKKISQLEGERIATSYPNSLRKFLKMKKINAAIIKIKGSVEIAPALGLADAICDITQTGNTLKENALKPIKKLFDSAALLIESPFKNEQKDQFIKKSSFPNSMLPN